MNGTKTTCETCKHHAIIEIKGNKIGFCRKIAPNIDWDICFDYEEKKFEPVQENLFKIIDNLKNQ